MGDGYLSDQALVAFERALHAEGFRGDLETGLGARVVASTDNSIYEVRPSAIVYPREGRDINRIVAAALAVDGEVISLTARGGNTGTNGQSLSEGVVVDFARYMTNIVQLDAAARLVVVEPGVVLDQLNRALARHGLFFPPMVSTASRATIGGMVATDASGKGSRVYGKTSDYIEAIDVVLADASDFRVEAMPLEQAEELARQSGPVGEIHRETLRICSEKADVIAETFPDMNRGLTGYNLQQAFNAETGQVSLPYLLAGSEGTLALTKAVTLSVAPLPSRNAMAVLRYDNFDLALRDVERILQADPLAVEILDDKVVGVAREDVVWAGIETVLGTQAGRDVDALLFVEFAGDEQEELERKLQSLTEMQERLSHSLIDITPVHDPVIIAELWKLREKSVGLLARLGGGRQGMPFVEDSAVPPQHLADYVSEFRALLDGYGLRYGMFGHADVGCLHVRPFLDMKDPEQAALIRPVSDGVAALTKKYSGLLWGEHGRGYRGEYSPFFFGPELYPELVRIKAAFDPHNRFNPGKLAAPDGGPVHRIDGVDLRGSKDSSIAPDDRKSFDRAIACNGNGACFSWDTLDILCPSYKASRDRTQSPKGRAALLRSWARAQSEGAEHELPAIEEATADALSTCLSCKACTSLCPVKVDIPTMKSRFWERYFSRHKRPLRHHVLSMAEKAFALGRRFPRLANALLAPRLVRGALDNGLGFVDLPRFAVSGGPPVPVFDPADWDARPGEAKRCVVLVEDTFTASFDSAVQDAAVGSLRALGYQVFRMPARENGKILHLLGKREAFAEVAARRVAECEAIASRGIRLIGLDAATSLMFEQEYREFLPESTVRIIGLEELLSEDLATMLAAPEVQESDERYVLLGHCTEMALRPGSLAKWAEVLAAFGIAATPKRTGCCGMAGLFGHEKSNADMSRKLFELSWEEAVSTTDTIPLATGYSCRSQTARMAEVRPMHPVELLHKQFEGRDAPPVRQD